MAINKTRLSEQTAERIISFPETLTYPFSRVLDYPRQYLSDLYEKLTDKITIGQSPRQRLNRTSLLARAVVGTLFLSSLNSIVPVSAQEDPANGLVAVEPIGYRPEVVALSPAAAGPSDAPLETTPDALDQAQADGSDTGTEVGLANPDSSSNLNVGDSVFTEAPKPFSPLDIDKALTYGQTFGNPDQGIFFVNNIPPDKTQIQVSIVLPENKISLYQSLIKDTTTRLQSHLVSPDYPVFQDNSIPLRIMDGKRQFTSNGEVTVSLTVNSTIDSVELFNLINYKEWPYRDSDNPIHITNERHIEFLSPIIDTFKNPDKLNNFIKNYPTSYYWRLNSLFLVGVNYKDRLFYIHVDYPDGRSVDY